MIEDEEDDETIKIEVIIKRESERAYLFCYEGEDVWVPKSQIRCLLTYGSGDGSRVEISRWIAEQKGIA